MKRMIETESLGGGGGEAAGAIPSSTVRPSDITGNDWFGKVCFHPKEDLLAAGNLNGEIYVWTYSDNEEHCGQKMELKPHRKSCRALRFTADGELLVSVSKDKSFVAIDLTTGRPTCQIRAAHESAIFSLALISRFFAATGDEDGTVKIWDYRVNNAVMNLKPMEEYVSSLKVTPDKRTLIATSGEGTLTAFNIRANKLELQSELFESEFLCAEIVKNGEKVVVGSGDGALNIFNHTEWGNISDRFPGHPEPVDSICKVTENILCTGSYDGKIRAVNILPNRFLGIVGEHDDGLPVASLDIARSGNLLASCGYEGVIKFWKIDFLHATIVNVNKKAKRLDKKKHLQSSRTPDFFADLAEAE